MPTYIIPTGLTRGRIMICDTKQIPHNRTGTSMIILETTSDDPIKVK